MLFLYPALFFNSLDTFAKSKFFSWLSAKKNSLQSFNVCGTFGCKWACLTMKKFQNRKHDIKMTHPNKKEKHKPGVGPIIRFKFDDAGNHLSMPCWGYYQTNFYQKLFSYPEKKSWRTPPPPTSPPTSPYLHIMVWGSVLRRFVILK